MFRSDIPGSEMGSGEFGGWGAVAADLTGTQFAVVEALVKGVTLRIIDLPGYLATQNQTGNDREDLATDGGMVLAEFAKAMMYAKDGVDAILVTLEAGRRFTREEQLLMEFISLLQFWDHCILLFTHGDKVGKNEDERYGNMHKLIASPDFSSRCPVLHKMLQYVSKRFIIVESVNRKDDPHYYHSKMDELCKAIELVRGRSGTMNHQLLNMAQKAFEAGLKELDHKEEKERLTHKLQEEEDRVNDYESRLAIEKGARERFNQRLVEEVDKHTQFINQKHKLQEVLQQKQLSLDTWDSGLRVLMQWLEEPQTGPAEFADMIDALGTPCAEPAEVSIQNQDDSPTYSAVPKDEPFGAQRNDVDHGTQKRSWKCVFL